MSDLADEEFVLPARMRSEVILRRGDEGAYVPPAQKLDVYLELQREAHLRTADFLRQALVSPDSDPALVTAAGRPDFGDLTLSSPLQAALRLALLDATYTVVPEGLGIVESWVLARGPAFAVRALAESLNLVATTYVAGQPQKAPFFTRRVVDYPPWRRWPAARRLLSLLAGASEAEYREAEAAASEYRDGARSQRALTSFLFRERTEWVDGDVVALIQPGHLQQDLTCYSLLTAITTPAQIAEFAARHRWLQWPADQGVLATLLASVGPAAAALLVPWLDSTAHYRDSRPRLITLVAELGGEEAISGLIERIAGKDGQHAVMLTGARFPRRTLRILAETDPADNESAGETWSKHVVRALILLANAHPEAARAVLPDLGAAARARLESALAGRRELPDAQPASLPEILVSPPWLNRTAIPKPVVVKGLSAPTEASVVWAEGERERWAATRVDDRRSPKEPDDAGIASLFANRELYHYTINMPRFVCHASEELVRPLLESGWQPNNLWQAEIWGRAYLARFELLALPMTRHLKAPERIPLVAPFRSPEIAAFMADLFARVKSARAAAKVWLARHPEYAAEQLVPAAVGKPGKERQAAVHTLRWLAAKTAADPVAIAAAAYGDQAASAVRTLLESDGAENLPKTMPTLPAWAEPYALPQIAIAGRGSALPPEAVRHVVQMLSISKPDTPYAGLGVTKDAGDPVSLREFAWALFENWQLAGYPSEYGWAFDGLRWFGDDEIVGRLAPLIRAWPGEGGHTRAVTGLDVLASIGTDAALTAIHGVSQRLKFKALKDRAGEKITEIAEDLGLTADQLGDRLVPDLGLDPDGSLQLDFGPRRFVVGFDELLKPYVRDEAGKRLKALPKPGVKDDAELAKAATESFSALKKLARSVTSDQIVRLEQSMCLRRRWSLAEFGSYLVAHPLLRHLVQRLVWATYDADGNPLATFRVAEDLTFADLEDAAFEVAEDAQIGVAHPLDLRELIAQWSDVLADYEILQPFAQLGRQTYAPTADERAAASLTRFRGVKVPPGKIAGLTTRSLWRRGEPWDNGQEVYILRPLPDGRAVIANITPGLQAGMVADSDDQDVVDVWIARDGRPDSFPRPENCDPFGTLDPVTASEVLRDLTEVTAQ